MLTETATCRRAGRGVPTATMLPPLIYVAGPGRFLDPLKSTHQSIRIADALLAAEITPVVPDLALLWHLVSPKDDEQWLEYHRGLLVRCDAVLCIGVDSRELDLAASWGIPEIRVDSSDPETCVRAVQEWLMDCLHVDGGDFQ